MYKVTVVTINGNRKVEHEGANFNSAIGEAHRLVGRYLVEGTDFDWIDEDYDEPSDHAHKVLLTYPTGQTATIHEFTEYNETQS